MLQLQRITKTFGEVTAVHPADLTIEAGQFVGVIGRSGAGKSTLLRMINRLVEPSAGTIQFGDRQVTAIKGKALHQWRSDCAMIFQQFNLVGRLDVLTNVMLGRLHRMSTLPSMLRLFNDEDRIDAIRTLEWLGIVETAKQQADTLSGGQQQRVAIARALHQEPDLILADEPIASLDPLNAQKVMDALADIHRERNITVVTNLHTLDTARKYCQRIIGMRDGEIVFDGSPEALTSTQVKLIYGTDTEIDEATTSTDLNHHDLGHPFREKAGMDTDRASFIPQIAS
ncbi:MAG: phosphonate ABC transporter ATP-binding protein [Acidiferrobacterales bacterium]|nr:phosphonate ABC transporter ATP-binding protein [Acidiferrobacterales bacterium]